MPASNARNERDQPQTRSKTTRASKATTETKWICFDPTKMLVLVWFILLVTITVPLFLSKPIETYNVRTEEVGGEHITANISESKSADDKLQNRVGGENITANISESKSADDKLQDRVRLWKNPHKMTIPPYERTIQGFLRDGRLIDVKMTFGVLQDYHDISGQTIGMLPKAVGVFTKFPSIARADEDFDGDGVNDLLVLFNIRTKGNSKKSYSYLRRALFPSAELLEEDGRLLVTEMEYAEDSRLLRIQNQLTVMSFSFLPTRSTQDPYLHSLGALDSLQLQCDPGTFVGELKHHKNWMIVEHDQQMGEGFLAVVWSDPLYVVTCSQQTGQCKKYYFEDESHHSSLTGTFMQNGLKGGSSYKLFQWPYFVGFHHYTSDYQYHRGVFSVLSFETLDRPRIVYVSDVLPFSSFNPSRPNGKFSEIIDPAGFVWETDDKDSLLLSVCGGDFTHGMGVFKIQGFIALMEQVMATNFSNPDARNSGFMQYVGNRMSATFNLQIAPYNLHHSQTVSNLLK